jgi:protein tyrosine phosphatase (PTP) superfamily phosphohydrolase (DUF442 family)
MSNDPAPTFYTQGSGVAPALHAPRMVWRYASTQWRRVFGLNVSRLDDTLFVGGEFRADQWPALHALGIRAVLSLQAEREDEFEGEPPVTTLRLLVPDFQAPSIEQLQEACEFIAAAHADELPVMVHCHAGVGRAPLTAGAYLVRKGLSTTEAIQRIRLARPIVDLNALQYNRLLEWELRHRPRRRPAAGTQGQGHDQSGV